MIAQFLTLKRVREELESCGEAVQRIGCRSGAHLGQNDEATAALDQSADRGAIASTVDQIAFPVPGNQPIFDLKE